MNKVYVLPPNEDWIVDRFVKEWNEDNSDISVNNPYDANVIWLLSDWCWKNLYFQLGESIKTKKIVTTVHHIVPEKFSQVELQDFLFRDAITTVYHVYNELTRDFIKQYTKKKIYVLPYWANQKIWKITDTKENLRKKYNIPLNSHVIGSFQRDTEGKDLKSPKLEKGPDLLADYLESIKNDNLLVILGGWRRQYIIDRLKKANINYLYYEKPKHEIINDLYQCLDLYPITARCEGGPQALIECGLLNVPVISRDIGIARQVLSNDSINSDILLAKPSIPFVNHMKLPNGYNPYRNLLINL